MDGISDFNFPQKMHLYLKNGDQQRWLIIQLVEGHTPRIAGLSSDDTRSVTDNLEPAIWFKVMVLESISINCLKRVVCWTNGVKNRAGLPVTYSMYNDDLSCYNFDDDIDELFNLASYLIETNPLTIANESKRAECVAEYEQSLFRMLHCYILPNIILQPKDMECVSNALKSQNKSITQLEDITLMHSRLAEHYLTQLRNIREVEILPIIEKLVEENSVGKDMLKVLFSDLKKVEPLIRREVDKGQKKVDHLKEMERYGACAEQLSHDLASARRDRDNIHNNLAKHLEAKAMIQIALSNCGSTTKNELNETCQHYMRLFKRVQEEKAISKLTINKKLKAASVRECIQSVIRDLEKGKGSTGEEMSSDGQRATDVLDGNDKHYSEWQTLSQRLSSIVHDKDHPVGLVFTDFCQMLQINYREILRSVQNVTLGSARFMTSYDDFYVVSEQDLGFNKIYLEDQRNLILGHLYQMTEHLSDIFNNQSMMFVRKIRLCYEKCFFNQIGYDLILVYRIVYGKSMQILEKRITRLKQIEICQLGLQMKDEWWLELFEPDNLSLRESNNGSISGMGEEFGDDEDLTDYEEEDYCTDDEQKDFFRHKESIDTIKEKLNLSKSKILSQSVPSLLSDNKITSIELIKLNSTQLKDAIKERVDQERPRFDSLAMDRFLRDECITERNSLKKYNSTSSVNIKTVNLKPLPVPTKVGINDEDSFDYHFGQALTSIKNSFTNSSPLKKMQCLTGALRLIASKVEELRMRGEDAETVERSRFSVTAEDLLPLLVLVLLKLSPHDAAKLYVELLFVADLMADFLSSGCHSYALCEFQIAFRVLDQTCDELSL